MEILLIILPHIIKICFLNLRARGIFLFIAFGRTYTIYVLFHSRGFYDVYRSKLEENIKEFGTNNSVGKLWGIGPNNWTFGPFGEKSLQLTVKLNYLYLLLSLLLLLLLLLLCLFYVA